MKKILIFHFVELFYNIKKYLLQKNLKVAKNVFQLWSKETPFSYFGSKKGLLQKVQKSKLTFNPKKEKREKMKTFFGFKLI